MKRNDFPEHKPATENDSPPSVTRGPRPSGFAATVAGEQIGSYRLVKPIGSGGMGEVWMAEHALLGRRAAIKLLHPAFSARNEIVTRFFNEARAATAIADPGIVQIFDFGYHTDGSAYIVMELLDGETLDARWRRHGRIAVPDALRIMRQVSSSLGAAHQRGIVHRDLKPENIFLVRDPEVPGGERAKILDFGIAKLTAENAVKTQTSAVMGTPTFMSPEQCRGAGHVDQRADIYSLGCVLFTVVVGRAVFDADGVGELIAMHMMTPAPRAASLIQGIPPAVDDLITRCLAKDPNARYASGADLAVAIGLLLGQPSVTAALSAPNTDMPHLAVGASPTTLSGSAVSHVIAKPRSSRRSLVIGVVAVGGIGGGVGIWAATHRSEAPTMAPVIAPVVVISTDASVAELDAPLAPDKRELATAQLAQILIAFDKWAQSHAGAPCPSITDLGSAVETTDPWGHQLRVTCTDQPSDQRIGVVSAGPDGVPKTDDDLESWALPSALRKVANGGRWVAATKPAVPGRPTSRPTGHSLSPVVAHTRPQAAPPTALTPPTTTPSTPTAPTPATAPTVPVGIPRKR